MTSCVVCAAKIPLDSGSGLRRQCVGRLVHLIISNNIDPGNIHLPSFIGLLGQLEVLPPIPPGSTPTLHLVSWSQERILRLEPPIHGALTHPVPNEMLDSQAGDEQEFAKTTKNSSLLQSCSIQVRTY